MTQRVIRAIESPSVTMLGHPTGRLLLRREGYRINISKVIDAAIANRVIIEINANPQRLDMDGDFGSRLFSVVNVFNQPRCSFDKEFKLL